MDNLTQNGVMALSNNGIPIINEFMSPKLIPLTILKRDGFSFTTDASRYIVKYVLQDR